MVEWWMIIPVEDEDIERNYCLEAMAKRIKTGFCTHRP